MSRKGFNERYGNFKSVIERATDSSAHDTNPVSQHFNGKSEAVASTRRMQERAEADEVNRNNHERDMLEAEMNAYEEGLIKNSQSNNYNSLAGKSPQEHYKLRQAHTIGNTSTPVDGITDKSTEAATIKDEKDDNTDTMSSPEHTSTPLNKPVEKVREGDVSSLTSRKVVYGAARSSMLGKQARNLEAYQQKQHSTQSQSPDQGSAASTIDSEKPYQLTPEMRVDIPSPGETAPSEADIANSLPKPDWQVVAEETNAIKRDLKPSVESETKLQLFGMNLPQIGPDRVFAARSFRDTIRLHVTKAEGEAKRILEEIISQLEYAPNQGISEEQAARVATLAQRYNELHNAKQETLPTKTAPDADSSHKYTEKEAEGVVSAVEKILNDNSNNVENFEYTPEEAEMVVRTVQENLETPTVQPKDEKRRCSLNGVFEKPITSEQSEPGLWQRLFGKFKGSMAATTATQERVLHSQIRPPVKALLLALVVSLASCIPEKIADGTYTPGPAVSTEPPLQPGTQNSAETFEIPQDEFTQLADERPAADVPHLFTASNPDNAISPDVAQPAEYAGQIEGYQPQTIPGSEIPSYPFETNNHDQMSVNLSDYTVAYNTESLVNDSEKMFTIEPFTYTVKAGDRGLSYILREQYPDIFPPEGDPAWKPVIAAWQGDTELCAKAGFPRANLDLIMSGDQFALDVFVKDYLEHYAPDEVKESYTRK